MLDNSDFRNALDYFSTPTLIAKPLSNSNNEVTDFSIEYTNHSFTEKTQKSITCGTLFSTFSKRLSSDVKWYDMANQALLSDKPVSYTFFSLLFNCWLRLVMNKIPGGYIAVSLTDISVEKDHEQQLKRQNLRLASLTDELSMSRTDLRNKLDNIETLNQQLQRAAYHDTLTDLFNRAWFNNCLSSAIVKASHDNSKFGIIFLDIDDMKNINDSRGHNAGDELIRQVAGILRKFERDTITPFRFGGDEFLILVQSMNTRDRMITISDTLLEAFNAEGINVSGGISVYPDDSIQAEELMKFADMAMFDVKKNGKNNIAYFQHIMQEKFLNKVNIENRLSKAMADKNFQLYFQPQFNIATNNLRGFEALLRWHDDDLGWISPEQFIPLAEESRLIILPLGDWVLDTALATLQKWMKAYNFKGIMSVNVSPVQLKESNFIMDLSEKLSKYKVTPQNLEIEITEGVLIDNMQEVVKKLNQIRAMGIGVSLDDFGTGYSSLRYLQILPLTTLKIDKSFIANISSKEGVEADITDSIISMVTRMGLDTIAEGVETGAQLDMLKKINCHNIQGFLKGKPMPESLCERVLSGDSSAMLTIENDSEDAEAKADKN
jgi:diguanylate cyclase (GGDEF)-like protein